MKISELISKLADIQASTGDVEVVTGDDFRNPYFLSCSRVETVEARPEDGGFDYADPDDPRDIRKTVVYIR